MLAVYVRRGLGTGAWAAKELVDIANAGSKGWGGSMNFDAVDVNGDGWKDLVISIYAGQTDGGLHITFFNNGGNGFSCAGDVTGDGETGVKDILTVIDDWGCNEGEPLD